MAINVEATYVGGVLRPLQPLPLKEHEQVRLTVETNPSWADRTSGIIPMPAGLTTIERFANDPELDVEETQ